VVAVVTDGGMPSVSDPGYRLVRAALDAGFPVTAVPGPSAVTTALALSGLPSDRFVFEGFLPRSGSGRRSRLRELAAEPRTLVLFEAPHRIADALADLVATFGADRPAAVCRELTKTYEEIRRGTLAELADWAGEVDPRGEITVVVGGAPVVAAEPPADEVLRAAVAGRESSGDSRRDAITAVATQFGLRKRDVYALVVNTQPTGSRPGAGPGRPG
jgi:16S rRNA (cytidine1402-2'-O)-methyltransferase